MNRTRPSLTEKTAAIAYARAINTHEIELLAPLLHDGLRVIDQRRWTPALGGRRYSGMLEDFFQAVPREKSATTMELATLPQNPYAPYPPQTVRCRVPVGQTRLHRALPCTSRQDPPDRETAPPSAHRMRAHREFTQASISNPARR